MIKENGGVGDKNDDERERERDRYGSGEDGDDNERDSGVVETDNRQGGRKKIGAEKAEESRISATNHK